LVGIKGVPAHALSQAVAQYLLGSSCTKVELATADMDGVDVEDGHELFVAAWCVHLGLILVIPEPVQPRDPCGILFLREHENFHNELPSLHYLAMRVIELQDFPSALDDDDSGDNNYNGYHPWIDKPSRSRSRSFGPRTVSSRKAGGTSSLRGSGSGFCLHVAIADARLLRHQVAVNSPTAER
jgi:hypothetical protein